MAIINKNLLRIPFGPGALSFFNLLIALIIIFYVTILFTSTGSGYIIFSILLKLASGGGKKNAPRRASILSSKILAIILFSFLRGKNLGINLGFPLYSLLYFANFQILRDKIAKSYTVNRKYIYLAFLIVLFFSS